jgi:hypothetical protein
VEITDRDLAWALAEMSMLKFFPSGESGEMAQEAIVRLLRRMVGSREQLRWLVQTLVDRVGHWPGPAEVRGLLCTQYRPADGIEAPCTLAGYSPADGEAKTATRDVPRLAAPDAQKLLCGIVDDASEMLRLQAKLNALRAQPKPAARLIAPSKPVEELTPDAAAALERWRQKWPPEERGA